MRISSLLFAPALAGLLALSACDQPKFRDTSAAPAGQAAGQATPPVPATPTKATAAPEPPAWAAAHLGKPLRAQFAKSGICKGNTDLVTLRYTGEPAGVQILGWGWDVAKKARVGRVVLVDKSMSIVGAGEGGVARPDVPSVIPEVTDANTGWTASAPRAAGPLDAYGVVGDGDAVCVLGHIEF